MHSPNTGSGANLIRYGIRHHTAQNPFSVPHRSASRRLVPPCTGSAFFPARTLAQKRQRTGALQKLAHMLMPARGRFASWSAPVLLRPVEALAETGCRFAPVPRSAIGNQASARIPQPSGPPLSALVRLFLRNPLISRLFCTQQFFCAVPSSSPCHAPVSKPQAAHHFTPSAPNECS